MLKESKFMLIPLILTVIALLLCTALLTMGGLQPLVIAGVCVAIVALLASLLYIFQGGAKKAASYLLFFKIMYCLSSVMAAILAWQANVLFGVICSLCVILILLITIVQNPGEAFSMNICALLCILRLFAIALAFLAIPGVSDGMSLDLASVFRSFGEFAMAATLLTCTLAKYRDKKARGRAV